MAEALVDLPDPLSALLHLGAAAPPDQVAQALARSLAPPEANCVAPAWLRPDQVAPFRRAVAAIERYRTALLADPVGSGKTYIALAVAATVAAEGTAVAIVPASLKAQWQRTAAALGIPILLHSHEALSRGRLPDSRARLALIDESHRFRTPGIRRYRELARWLVGRKALLLSATPVVNRLADLGHQLRLGLRDDALAYRGVLSLSALLERGEASPALGDVVLCRSAPTDRPLTRVSQLRWDPGQSDSELLAAIDGLALSRDRGVAALLRLVLWRALASSRAALAAALDRYGRLLQHAASAAETGRPVSRAAIRAFSDGTLTQLVLWELLPPPSGPADLVLEDQQALAAVTVRLRRGEIDQRITALRETLADRRPTLVFTGSRDTLEALRGALADHRPAWVTGAAAGIGHTRMPRETVLQWFRPDSAPAGAAHSASTGPRPSPPLERLGATRGRGSPLGPVRDRGQRPGPEGVPGGPSALLATDVAAEGLDLQRAERIVHFDLPWTSVRLDQREGRAVRLGAKAAEVEIVRFAPWPELEARLSQDARLVAKRRLATIAGLDDDGRWLFRWRVELAEAAGAGGGETALAIVAGEPEGWLVGFALDLSLPDGALRREPASLLWVEPSGALTEDPAITAARLKQVAGLPSLRSAGTGDRERTQQMLTGLVRSRLRAAQHTAWLSRQAPPEQRRLARRMRRLAAEAARQRNQRLLTLADQALDWLAGGVTAGEAAMVARLALAPAGQLPALWPALLRCPRMRPIPVPRLTGVIRVTRAPSCPGSGPCGSISTIP